MDLTASIGYGENIQKATDVMRKVLAEHPKVLHDPEPVVAVSALSDSSVDFVVRPWVKPADYWEVYFGVTRRVKEELDNAGIEIPFPQRVVHMHSAG